MPYAAELTARYRQVRAATEALAAPLAPEDQTPQSMPDASPVKWHRAHTTWFFETFVLEKAEPGYAPFDSGYRALFNSYYNAVGAQYARPQRGLITRPCAAEVGRYRAHVDAHLLAALEAEALADEQLAVVELGLHHEQQHQELLVTDVKHLLSHNPLHPVYARREAAQPAQPAEAAPPSLAWQRVAPGMARIGAADAGFAFDNERPAHDCYMHGFELATRPVTNGEYLEFMQDGGYARADLWLADGWAAVNERGWRAPCYWQRADAGSASGAWQQFTLAGLREVALAEPVTHISAYEADAYARWAGARLPSEAEWEVVAAAQAASAAHGNFAERGRLHPAPVGGNASRTSIGSADGDTSPRAGIGSADGNASRTNISSADGETSLRTSISSVDGETSLRTSNRAADGDASPRALAAPAHGMRQLFGDVWEWTASAYSAYPGYRAPTGALGEYNGKFMANQWVLRGGSCATPASHIRASYRNFFYPDARWQFSGIRLARDTAPAPAPR